MKLKHLPTCTVHHLTFEGHCLNCGLNAPKPLPKPTKSERIEKLKSLGSKFPK
jgi:hypothetical protein